jgi:hypothetical protein
VDDILTQLRRDGVHAALVIMEYGALAIGTVLWFYYQRYVKRCDEDEAERDLKAVALEEELDRYKAKVGMEIQDIHIVVSVLATQVKEHLPEASIEIPRWPQRG